MRTLVVVVGVLLVLVGALWLLQGLGFVTIPPILCVAECVPLEGASIQWALTGAVVILVGAGAINYARVGRRWL